MNFGVLPAPSFDPEYFRQIAAFMQPDSMPVRPTPSTVEPAAALAAADPNWVKLNLGMALAGRLREAIEGGSGPKPITVNTPGLTTENLMRMYAIKAGQQGQQMEWDQYRQQREDALRREQQAQQIAERQLAARAQERRQDRADKLYAEAMDDWRAEVARQVAMRQAAATLGIRLQESAARNAYQQARIADMQARTGIMRDKAAKAGSGGGSKTTKPKELTPLQVLTWQQKYAVASPKDQRKMYQALREAGVDVPPPPPDTTTGGDNNPEGLGGVGGAAGVPGAVFNAALAAYEALTGGSKPAPKKSAPAAAPSQPPGPVVGTFDPATGMIVFKEK